MNSTRLADLAHAVPVFFDPLIENCVAAKLPMQTGVLQTMFHLIVYGKSTELANCEVFSKKKGARSLSINWACSDFGTKKVYELRRITRSPNWTATVDLGTVAVNPDTSIRVLGLTY